MDATQLTAFKLNLDALPTIERDAQDSSPCGADTDVFFITSSPANALNEMAFTWPRASDANNLDELNSLFTTSNESAAAQVGVAKLVPPADEPSVEELRDFTAVLMTPPSKTRPIKRKLLSDDGLEARYCQRKMELQSAPNVASPLTHYSRQRLEIAELTQVVEVLERQLQMLKASKVAHGFTAYEKALKSKADLLEAQETNMRLKHRVQGHLRQRQQLETIAFGGVLSGIA
ncbi:hypothetical protein DYB32_003638 [Aphanomyces invadans]|uniref:Uncharacterized protein n=1 Tax=Aphanomyces invadans TaxID=157072 RepID=A0A3R6WNL8_9STRA|nr:hypothetical protein DYB32_003638 [Aphanomyces invadans]